MMRNAANGSGVIGFNTNVANILAAVFIATGQDVACISEGAVCQLYIAPARKDEIQSQGCHLYVILTTTIVDVGVQNTGKRYKSTPLSEKLAQLEMCHTTDVATSEGPQYDGIYACIDLPSLQLGTVGGGTGLATQREALSLLGCYGKVSLLGLYVSES